jgi:UDP-N-acetylglucosamine:LPS N-acetylglucosamine transferase
LDEHAETNERRSADEGSEAPLVWFLVGFGERRRAVDDIANRLNDRGLRTRVVTITEVLGSAAREAVAGGAERVLRGLRVAFPEAEGREEDFLAAIRREQPDLLVVTSPRYVRPLSLLESMSGIRSLQVALPLGFGLDRSWENGTIDAFVCADERIMESLASAGWTAPCLFQAGPPVDPGFDEARALDRSSIRTELGFGEDEKIVLVRAESFDATTLDRLVFQATLVERDVRFIFHHNGDGAAASALRRSADKHGLSAAMFGRVEDLERYVVAADAVVTPPNEPTLPDVVAAATPVVVVGDHPGGDGSVEVLADAFGALHIPDVLRVGSELEDFLADASLNERRQTMRDASWEPDNTEVVEALRQILETAEEIRTAGARPTGSTSPQTDGPSDDTESKASGPFETIGGDEPADESDASGRTSRRLPSGDGGARRGLSRAEAKDQLAELILVERDLERQLSDLQREEERWRNRLDLARDWGEDELADEAESVLRGYLDDIAEVQEDLEDVRRQKTKLKKAARRGQEGGSGGDGETGAGSVESSNRRERRSELEDRFSEMEIDRDLDRLRDKMNDELGD